MTAFAVVAAAMLIVALAFLLVPLLSRRSAAVAIERDASNVALLREQVRELDADLAAGTLSTEQHRQSKRELEARVLEESVPAPGAAASAPRAGVITAAVLGASIPVLAVAGYLAWGGLEAFSPHPGGGATAAADGQHDLSPAKVEEMVGRLAARLEQEPGNAEGWVVLARTYYSMNRFPDAVRAFERAVALLPGDASLLADYADALGATQNGLAGKPTQIIEQALKADPTQWKALALAGTAAFDRKDFAAAVAYWERLKTTVPPDAPIAKSIDNSIAEARALGGLKGPVAAAIPPASSTAALASAPAPAPAAPVKMPPGNGAPLAGTSVAGTVALEPVGGRQGRAERRRVRVRAAGRRVAHAGRDPAQGGQGSPAEVHARRLARDEPDDGDLPVRRGHRRCTRLEVRQRRPPERRSRGLHRAGQGRQLRPDRDHRPHPALTRSAATLRRGARGAPSRHRPPLPRLRAIP